MQTPILGTKYSQTEFGSLRDPPKNYYRDSERSASADKKADEPLGHGGSSGVVL
jgi:hypothetical protein